MYKYIKIFNTSIFNLYVILFLFLNTKPRRRKMNIGAKAVNLRKVQQDAENHYRGGFFCCEAVMAAMRENFELDVPEDVIGMASAMSVGAGRSGCMCGALNGGILALGMFFGRTEPRGPKDPEVNKCMSYSNELHNWFKEMNGKKAVCCRVLTREFDMGRGEHKNQCIYYTGICAWKVAEIVCRELGIEVLDSDDEKKEPRERKDIVA